VRPDNKDAVVAAITGVLKTFPLIKVAILYGSGSRDQLQAYSDVDVAVGSGNPLAWETKQDLQLRLSEVLDRGVDLIDLETLEGVLWETLWSEGTFVLWDHDLIVKYAGKVQGFTEDVKPQLIAEIDRRLQKAFGPL